MVLAELLTFGVLTLFISEPICAGKRFVSVQPDESGSQDRLFYAEKSDVNLSSEM